MIARVWRATAAHPGQYRRVFEEEVLHDLQEVPGFRGAYLLADGPELVTLTLFDSMAAVRRFAGDGYEHEHVTPAARATLLRSDPAVRHYEVLAQADGPGG
ncbi:antibiotic biosynthesis monooxygenase family protein [Nonomuraea jiangxiensis]|uniref:Heme-degrading monooxygenase HmoA n=1 Tax=Nonomuraea jiangxiensis TaxID=633440 RepID=A0A1G9MH59_9ACTN|nr:hypothetical protein [Nonomuraea jiangxiensis]SDL73331.1 Heme-degrading monooxygenase HmoA [Nonomuraea jiangxiensis]